MLEARAHAGPGSSEAERGASILQLALGDALQGDMGPVERSGDHVHTFVLTKAAYSRVGGNLDFYNLKHLKVISIPSRL